jgi:hypothetical protein
MFYIRMVPALALALISAAFIAIGERLGRISDWIVGEPG